MEIARYEVSLHRLMNLTEHRDSRALVGHGIDASNLLGNDLEELYQVFIETESWMKEEEAGLARVREGATRAKAANAKQRKTLEKNLAATREAADDAPSRGAARELDEAAAAVEADIALLRGDDLQKESLVAAAGARVAVVRSKMHYRRQKVLEFVADALYADIAAEATEAGFESQKERKNAETLRCLELDPAQTHAEALRRSGAPEMKKRLRETEFAPDRGTALRVSGT